MSLNQTVFDVGLGTAAKAAAALAAATGDSSEGSQDTMSDHAQRQARVKDCVVRNVSLYFDSCSVPVPAPSAGPLGFIQEEIHALKWWRTTGTHEFPFVAPVARVFFSAISSSAQTERLFKKTKVWCEAEQGLTSDNTLEVLTVVSLALSNPNFDLKSLFFEASESPGPTPSASSATVRAPHSMVA